MIPKETTSPAGKPTERDRQSARTRRKLILAARRLLGRRGSFTIDEIARAAGVTRLTVYHQFASRGGLLDAVFDDIAEQTGLAVAIPSVFAKSDAVTAFRCLAEVFADFWSSHMTRLPALRLRSLDAEIRERMEARAERRRMVIGRLCDRFLTLSPSAQERDDLIDILFAVTSFEFYELLGGRTRSHEHRSTMVMNLVEDLVRPHADRSARRQPTKRTVTTAAVASTRSTAATRSTRGKARP